MSISVVLPDDEQRANRQDSGQEGVSVPQGTTAKQASGDGAANSTVLTLSFLALPFKPVLPLP
jgi:hypothetical protein